MSLKEAGDWIGGLTRRRRPDRHRAWAPSWPTCCGKFTRRAYLLLAASPSWSRDPAGPRSASSTRHAISSLGLLFVAMVLLAMVLGPCNTVTANVVPANRRAAGYAAVSSS